MDEQTRRGQNNDNHRQASRHNETEQRDEPQRLREAADERPALTRRERDDPWPIG